MKLSALLKSMLVLGVLLCMAGTASAQFDLDVKNATPCQFRVRFINDDGTGTCTTCGGLGALPAMSYTTHTCGATSGAVYLAAVTDGVTAAIVGDCSLTSCPGCVLPASTTISTSCGVFNVDYYAPGTMVTNALVIVY